MTQKTRFVRLGDHDIPHWQWPADLTAERDPTCDKKRIELEACRKLDLDILL